LFCGLVLDKYNIPVPLTNDKVGYFI